jgi:hypothetical protein
MLKVRNQRHDPRLHLFDIGDAGITIDLDPVNAAGAVAGAESSSGHRSSSRSR